MSEGDTQGEAPELPSGLYDNILGRTDTAEETPATEQEQEQDGGTETEEAPKAEAATETPKADPTSGNWEERYTNLSRKFGEQGNELGTLRKELAELKTKLEQGQKPQDPFQDDPTLRALDPTQKQLVLRGTDVAMKRLLQDMGMAPEDLPRMKQMVQEIQQTTVQESLTREVSEIRKEFGEAAFAKYLPKLQEVARTHPTLSPREAWDLATAKDLRGEQTRKAQALETERKQRAASADFGKERPNKQENGKLNQESLRKLSAQPQGRPSPRLAAIMREVRREMGG